MLVDLANLQPDVLHRSFNPGLPVLVGSGNPLQGSDPILSCPFGGCRLLQGIEAQILLDLQIRKLAFEVVVDFTPSCVQLLIKKVEFLRRLLGKLIEPLVDLFGDLLDDGFGIQIHG
jgi:hypothetical protein